jgi:hypothetical protein
MFHNYYRILKTVQIFKTNGHIGDIWLVSGTYIGNSQKYRRSTVAIIRPEAHTVLCSIYWRESYALNLNRQKNAREYILSDIITSELFETEIGTRNRIHCFEVT